MAGDHLQSWQSALQAVYELILYRTDKIVDDTSLEKLLELLKCIQKDSERRKFLTDKTTLQFLRDVREGSNAAAVGFGLRLAGIIGSNVEGFSVLTNLGSECSVFPPSSNIFRTVAEARGGLWSDAVVRDSYFKGGMALLNVTEGIAWAQGSGCVQEALRCLVDSSIFVADSARKVLSKYLVSSFALNQFKMVDMKSVKNGQNVEPMETFHSHRTCETRTLLTEEEIGCVQCIVCHLHYLVRKPLNSLEDVLPYHASVAQLVLCLFEESSLVAQEMLRSCGLLRACLDLLHFSSKDECSKVVDVLITLMHNTRKWSIGWELLLDERNTLYVLLEFALILCKRSFVFLAFEFTQGLFQLPCIRECQDAWWCALFTVLTFPVYWSLRDVESSHVRTSNCNPKDAAKNLLSEESSKVDAYQVLVILMEDSLKEYTSCASVSRSLSVTIEVIQNLEVTGPMHLKNLVADWARDVLALLTERLKKCQSGKRIVWQSTKALSKYIALGLVKNQDGFDNESFKLLLRLAGKVSDEQTLSCCLEGIKELLLRADQSALVHYIHESVEGVTLDVILSLHCSESCWDVKDTVLCFLKCLLEALTAEKKRLCQDFLLEHRLLETIWTFTRDKESFVRAAAISFLKVISRDDNFWKRFCDAIRLSQKEVLHALLDAFLVDEAAFPRRAIIDMLTFWVDNKHGIVAFIMRQESEVPDQRSSVQRVSLDPCVQDVLAKACQDFDWEVKICALNFWRSVIKMWHDENATESDEFDVVLNSDDFIKCASSLGLDRVVLNALVDCDKPVRSKAVELLQMLQSKAVDDSGNSNPTLENHKFRISSATELQDCLSKEGNEASCTLKDLILAVDLNTLGENYGDDDFFSDPLPFLRDILLAATDSDDNFLDCY